MPDLIIPQDNDQVLVPASSYAASSQPPVTYPEQANHNYITESKNPALNAARNTLLMAETSMSMLNQLREAPDPRQPVAASRQELADRAGKGKAGFLNAYDAAMKTLGDEISSNENHIAAMGGFSVNPQAAEIRGVIRKLDQQEREALIGNAVESLDESLLACVMGCHPLTLGVSPEFMAAQRNRYLQKVVPDYLALRDTLANAKSRLETAKPLVLQTYDKAGSGIEEFSAQIAKAEALRTTKH